MVQNVFAILKKCIELCGDASRHSSNVPFILARKSRNDDSHSFTAPDAIVDMCMGNNVRVYFSISK